MGKAKLNQIVAVVTGMKTRAQRVLTDAHRGWSPEVVYGLTKTYVPKDEEGDALPPESRRIQVDVRKVASETCEHLVRFIDAVMTQDYGNTRATADVSVNGKLVLGNVPVTSLMFLEKQLNDLRTFVGNLPTLTMDRDWKYDANRDCFVTEPTETVRTQKMPKVITKYEATKEHPAQTELLHVDVPVGTWTTTYMSTAIPVDRKKAMLQRVEELQDAVKKAREEANSISVDQIKAGHLITEYIFRDMIGAQS